jgi:hypothetical protein
MRPNRGLLILSSALLALFVLAACGPFWPAEPTARPTRELPTTAPGEGTATSTWTPVIPPTQTPVPTASSTLTPTLTPTPTLTSTPTFTPTVVPTDSPVPSDTPTPRPPTATPTPTLTPAPPTATPTDTATPPVQITDWRGEYYGNVSLSLPAKVVRNDRVVDFAFAQGTPPAAGMPSENWSARWSRTWRFDEGNYRFHLTVDDGARLWVGGVLLIDRWTDGPAREFTANRYLKGEVSIRLDYYNHLGDAQARLNWERVDRFDHWQGTYYTVRDLSGLPLFQRDDTAIDFDWGTGTPRGDMPADNFSVRWVRQLRFDNAGRYRFRAESDDGVRLWVDGKLAIDAWRDGPILHEAMLELAAGVHDLRVEYYEHWGEAFIKLSWTYVAPTATPVPPTDTPIPPTNTPVPPTNTPIQPIVSPLPPEPTAPIRPDLSLSPAMGPIGKPFAVLGNGWPADGMVDLYLARLGAEPGIPTLVEQVKANQMGSFDIQLTIPPGQGWEGQDAALIWAQTADQVYAAEASYRILPELVAVPFERIPTDQDHFALVETTYLVLDSMEGWVGWFGDAPAPVDWEREVVVGAFLGPQPPGVETDVDRIVHRNGTVSVWLTHFAKAMLHSDDRTPNVPRVLVRVAREELPPQDDTRETGLIFAFLDAGGQLLAQGAMGPAEPGQPVPSQEVPRARSLEAPAAPAEDTPSVAVEATGPEPKAAVAVEGQAEVEEAAPEAMLQPEEERSLEGEAQAEAPAQTRLQEAQPILNLVGWILLGAGIILLGALGVYAWRRQR